jgi:hypothetical protein
MSIIVTQKLSWGRGYFLWVILNEINKLIFKGGTYKSVRYLCLIKE